MHETNPQRGNHGTNPHGVPDDMNALLRDPVDGSLPAAPSSGQPAPQLPGQLQVDFGNPAHCGLIAPEVLTFVRSLGAVSATITQTGAEDHARIQLARGLTQQVSHPDIKRIKYSGTIEFSLRKTQSAAGEVLEISKISGIELDVGLVFAWAKPSAVKIKADGSFEAEATAMGVKAKKAGVAPQEVVELVKKGMESFDRLLAARP